MELNYIELLDATDNKTYFKVLFEAGMPHEIRKHNGNSSLYNVVKTIKNFNDKNLNKKKPDLLFSNEEAMDMIEKHLQNSTEVKNLSIQEFANAFRMFFGKEQAQDFIFYMVNIYKDMDLNTAEEFIADSHAVSNFFTNNYPLMFEVDCPSLADLLNGQREVLKVIQNHCADILHVDNILTTQSGGAYPKTRIYCVSSTTEPINTEIMFNILKAGLKLLPEVNEDIYKSLEDKNFILPEQFIGNMKDLALYHKLNFEVPQVKKADAAFKI